MKMKDTIQFYYRDFKIYSVEKGRQKEQNCSIESVKKKNETKEKKK